MDISIIIVTWNSKNITLDCIRSIYDHTSSDKFDFEIILVDNASDDKTIGEVNRLYPKVHIIRNQSNLGFARANNIGIKKAKGNVILLLNSDTIIKDNAIYKTYKFLTEQGDDVAAVTCKLLNPDGSTQINCRQFYTLKNLIKRAIGKFGLFLPRSIRSKWCIDLWQHNNIRAVDWVHMSFFMVRRPVLEKVDTLSETFYFYGEDMEFCYRLYLNNFKIVFFPKTEIIHIGGVSAEKHFSDIPLEFQKTLILFYQKYDLEFEKIIMKTWFYFKSLQKKILMMLQKSNLGKENKARKSKQTGEKELNKYRIAILASHPIHYQIMFFKKLFQHPKMEGMIYFCSDFGIREGLDKTFGKVVKWYDSKILDGLPYKFLENYSWRSSIGGFDSEINPGIIAELFKNRYDAILINGYVFLTNWLAFWGAWLTGTATIFKGETDLSNPRSLLKRIVKKPLLIPLFSGIKAFLYSYTGNAEYYKHYKVSENKLFFCPCAVDNSFWQKQAVELRDKKIELKKNFGIPDNYPVILFVGKLIPRKRPMDLLKAHELLCNQKVNTILIFAGDGPEGNILRNYAKDKKLERVHFAGFRNQSELPVFYSLTDIFVLPSNHDPSPKTLNEAMNFSLPIITTNKVGTAPDLIKQEENGFIYPVGDIKALTDCLLRVLRDQKTTEEMGRKSLEIVSKWSFEEDVNGILNAFEYVTSSKKT